MVKKKKKYDILPCNCEDASLDETYVERNLLGEVTQVSCAMCNDYVSVINHTDDVVTEWNLSKNG